MVQEQKQKQQQQDSTVLVIEQAVSKKLPVAVMTELDDMIYHHPSPLGTAASATVPIKKKARFNNSDSIITDNTVRTIMSVNGLFDRFKNGTSTPINHLGHSRHVVSRGTSFNEYKSCNIKRLDLFQQPNILRATNVFLQFLQVRLALMSEKCDFSP
jgi:hypothetical protein